MTEVQPYEQPIKSILELIPHIKTVGEEVRKVMAVEPPVEAPDQLPASLKRLYPKLTTTLKKELLVDEGIMQGANVSELAALLDQFNDSVQLINNMVSTERQLAHRPSPTGNGSVAGKRGKVEWTQEKLEHEFNHLRTRIGEENFAKFKVQLSKDANGTPTIEYTTQQGVRSGRYISQIINYMDDEGYV